MAVFISRRNSNKKPHLLQTEIQPSTGHGHAKPLLRTEVEETTSKGEEPGRFFVLLEVARNGYEPGNNRKGYLQKIRETR